MSVSADDLEIHLRAALIENRIWRIGLVDMIKELGDPEAESTVAKLVAEVIKHRNAFIERAENDVLTLPEALLLASVNKQIQEGNTDV